MATGSTFSGLHQVGMRELKRNWGWFLALGILMIVLGTIAIGAAVVASLVSVLLFGSLLIVGGVSSVIHAFWREKGWSGIFINLATGVLYAAVGFMLVANPAAGAVALTLLIAMFLIIGGVFRIVVALSVRFHNWGWLLLHGLINLLLGFAIWAQWPLAGLWVIGLFVGIDLIFNGWALVMLGLGAKAIPDDAHAASAG